MRYFLTGIIHYVGIGGIFNKFVINEKYSIEQICILLIIIDVLCLKLFMCLRFQIKTNQTKKNTQTFLVYMQILITCLIELTMNHWLANAVLLIFNQVLIQIFFYGIVIKMDRLAHFKFCIGKYLGLIIYVVLHHFGSRYLPFCIILLFNVLIKIYDAGYDENQYTYEEIYKSSNERLVLFSNVANNIIYLFCYIGITSNVLNLLVQVKGVLFVYQVLLILFIKLIGCLVSFIFFKLAKSVWLLLEVCQVMIFGTLLTLAVHSIKIKNPLVQTMVLFNCLINGMAREQKGIRFVQNIEDKIISLICIKFLFFLIFEHPDAI